VFDGAKEALDAYLVGRQGGILVFGEGDLLWGRAINSLGIVCSPAAILQRRVAFIILFIYRLRGVEI
jgi:hypothetical protein